MGSTNWSVILSKEWFAGELKKSSDALASYAKRVDKESEPGTFGTTKFSAACVVGACVAAGAMFAVDQFFGPGVDRGAATNAMWTGLCYVELFAFNSTLAGFASPWTMKVLSSAAMGLSDTSSGLADSLKGADVPVIDFSKMSRNSTEIKKLPRSSSRCS